VGVVFSESVLVHITHAQSTSVLSCCHLVCAVKRMDSGDCSWVDVTHTHCDSYSIVLS